MKHNPRLEFWANLFSEMAYAVGRAMAQESLRTGKILMKDFEDDYVSFRCNTKEDMNCFIVNQNFPKVVKNVNPSIVRIELTAPYQRKKTIHLH